MEKLPIALEQYFVNLTPEKLLLVGILENAIMDCFGNRCNGEVQTPKKAKEYIFHSDSIEPFSYLWICDTLEIEPSILRRAVKKYLAAGGMKKPGRKLGS